MSIFCAECGKKFEVEEIEGSLQHPCCKDCFLKVFNNDYEKYTEFLINKES